MKFHKTFESFSNSLNEAKQPHKEVEKAIKGMKGVSMDIKGDEIRVSNKSGDEFIYSMNDGGDVAEFISTIEESKSEEIKEWKSQFPSPGINKDTAHKMLFNNNATKFKR